MKKGQMLNTGAFTGAMIFILLMFLFVQIINYYSSTIEVNEKRVTDKEFKCMTFCDNSTYYYDDGGLFSSSICQCKNRDVEEDK